MHLNRNTIKSRKHIYYPCETCERIFQNIPYDMNNNLIYIHVILKTEMLKQKFNRIRIIKLLV